jgi:hypothetical protein
MILATMNKNADNVKELLVRTLPKIEHDSSVCCGGS